MDRYLPKNNYFEPVFKLKIQREIKQFNKPNFLFSK